MNRQSRRDLTTEDSLKEIADSEDSAHLWTTKSSARRRDEQPRLELRATCEEGPDLV